MKAIINGKRYDPKTVCVAVWTHGYIEAVFGDSIEDA